MEISIRKASVGNAKSIATLSNQLGYKTSNTEMEIRLNEILPLPEHHVLVAISDKNIVGWIHACYCLRVESPTFVEITGLVVDENFRKKGVGKKLVEKAEEWSKSQNCKKIRVRCNVVRRESHKFYEILGFRILKEQKVFERNF